MGSGRCIAQATARNGSVLATMLPSLSITSAGLVSNVASGTSVVSQALISLSRVPQVVIIAVRRQCLKGLQQCQSRFAGDVPVSRCKQRGGNVLLLRYPQRLQALGDNLIAASIQDDRRLPTTSSSALGLSTPQ